MTPPTIFIAFLINNISKISNFGEKKKAKKILKKGRFSGLQKKAKFTQNPKKAAYETPFEKGPKNPKFPKFGHSKACFEILKNTRFSSPRAFGPRARQSKFWSLGRALRTLRKSFFFFFS